jgi:peptidoglycan/LPS O-acetylase OafA/YrhL
VVQLKYRSDIDGLRAVAVLGVVIYHAFPWVIPGGFIGVDIFFVISGYLISGILYKGLKAVGGYGNFSPFSFKEFYARRIRRLFPALITMLVITMAYGWLILLPDEFEQLGKHVAAGILFIQNIIFWQESGYFDTAASLKPLLHLWSLAVEEQFYIFFPPILLLIWRRKWPLAAILVVLLVISLVGNIWMSVHAATADFFLTPYRAWEFLGGSLLAWWHYDWGHEGEVPAYREVLSWSGLIILILGMAFIRTENPYPGWRAILPVAGTLLLMEGGAGGLKGAWVNRKILSNPAVVWVGLISYPLYLFHWPALSFVHIVKGENPKPVYLADALIISLILSVITYYFIEKKVRHHQYKLTIPLLIGAFFLTGLFGFEIFQKVIPARALTPPKVLKATTDKDMLHGFEKMPGDYSFCFNRAGGNGLQTLFVGDSNMQQYGSRIAKVLKNNNGDSRGALLLTGGGILPVIGVTNKNGRSSGDLTRKFQDLILYDKRIDRVVIAARWILYFNKGGGYELSGVSLGMQSAHEKVMDELGRSIRALVAQKKKVTVVLNTPSGYYLDPRIMYPRTFFGTYGNAKNSITKEYFLREHGQIIKEVAKVATDNGAEAIDPMDYLCTNGICIAEDENGISIRFDEGHLRPGYVRDHVTYLDRTMAP